MQLRTVRTLTLVAALFATSHVAHAQDSASSAHAASCRLKSAGNHWFGSCGRIFDEMPNFDIHRADSITTGEWQQDTRPTSVWAGQLINKGDPNFPLEIELYSGGKGIIRTEYGWYPVADFARSDSMIRFQIDTLAPVPPSALDREILIRASQILSSTAVWNRADDRRCPSTATQWSIYCAVERASIEVTGGFNHRRPAAELVRQIVERRTAGRAYTHRLMDYNNDPSTSLDDVHSLFNEALAQIKP
jgi:hypothetical protein